MIESIEELRTAVKAQKPMYCGGMTTYGHGEYAKCGEMFYTTIHQCGECCRKELDAIKALIGIQ